MILPCPAVSPLQNWVRTRAGGGGKKERERERERVWSWVMFVCLGGVNRHIWGERGYRSTPKVSVKTDGRHPHRGRLLSHGSFGDPCPQQARKGGRVCILAAYCCHLPVCL